MNVQSLRIKWLGTGLAAATFAAAPHLLAWQEPAPAPPMPPSVADVREMVQLAAGLANYSYLGVDVVEVNKDRARALNLKEEYGVEISRLQDDGPAAKAGLKTGDVVLEYNGQRVEGTQQFVRLVRETPGGRNVKLLVSRNGAAQSMLVTTGTRKNALPEISVYHAPNAPLPPDMPTLPNLPNMEGFSATFPDGARGFTFVRGSVLGVEVEPVGTQLAQYFGVKEGMLVRSVVAGSAAEKGGIKAGDVITKIDGAAVTSVRDITSKLRPTSGPKTSSVTVVRDKREMSLSVTIEENRSSNPGTRVRTVTVQNSNRI